MTKVVEKFEENASGTVFICDFSPPRGGDPELLEPARHLDVDFISLAYNPGKSTRVNSAFAAHWVKTATGKDATFTIATRDMNKLGLQSLLLGAQLLGLENVVVVKGDNFTAREQSLVRDVNDLRPTELIRSIKEMNEGTDFKGLKLRSPTDFCVGASVDLGRGIEQEVRLTRSKVEAGADYFVSQPTFRAEEPRQFLTRYAEQYGEELSQPVFHGVQVMTQDGIVLGDVPQWVTDDLASGRPGSDIALQILHNFVDAGLRSIYLVPPILRGGRRDYDAAAAVLEGFRG